MHIPRLLASLLLTVQIVSAASRPERAVDEVVVAPVWAGHSVGFSLLTHGAKQFVAYYDEQRRMTVAARDLPGTNWTFHVLPEKVVWDSHNYVTMALDDDGHLHVSGNMHCVPLVYFRTTNVLDIASLVRVPAMTGDREKRTTYPYFFRGASNAFLFMYRDGSSGSGDQIVNRYDTKTRTWMRLIDSPLTDGEKLMNAYFTHPRRGPDGFFHLMWVWRDHPGCESNHDVSYARSRDLVHWETSDGRPLPLPIRLKDAEIVDPIPAGGGVLNSNQGLGFDLQGRVVLSYHKYDSNGVLQVYNARREDKAWSIRQATDWTYRWEFKGGGTIRGEAGLSGVETNEDGRLVQSWWNSKDGGGTWELDPETLRPLKRVSAGGPSLAALDRTHEPLPEGLQWRSATDPGAPSEPGVRYVLRWATRPPNRDQPYPGDPPPPQMLRVIRVTR